MVLWAHVTSGNSHRFSDTSDSPFAQPLTASMQMPAVRTVQGDCGRVYRHDGMTRQYYLFCLILLGASPKIVCRKHPVADL